VPTFPARKMDGQGFQKGGQIIERRTGRLREAGGCTYHNVQYATSSPN